ncbi:MAG TPA: lysophospholipid acyltransferase family protein [Phycisphaerae bacterium]|nr:lysophospholipid acyltransferase family protein [Phycisphaerae bacterium]
METENLAVKPAAPESGQAAARRGELPISILARARIAFVRGFLVCWSKLFSMSGLYLLGQVFGTLEYLIDYKRRRRVHAKLRSFFKDEYPPPWFRRTAWRYFMRVRCDKMFYTIMDRIPRGKLMNRIKMFGRENVDNALARGNGVYIALCHFGAHHVAGLMTALSGYKVVGIRDPRESPVRRYIQNKYRETFPEVAGMEMFMASSFPRAVYRGFKENKLIASLLDVDRSRGENTKTHPVRFFGETREFLVGPIQIAVRCGATTLQGFIESRKNFYYRLSATPPLVDPQQVTDEEAMISDVLQRYADGVERFAREHPDHLMNI